ncbi:MAG: hypothetical protein QN183_06055 [Armatimonadota bacterium]|nr:hypothetical protein [Armatimonadota bacterium]MDR7485663.1 hypothetical protein [Armatimonadota bacterium]MDR7534300.1 hypothetical protein [Armatimonadota bacterium]MDR7535912.1 hypothetical protein [Armatimonadota bacterium]
MREARHAEVVAFLRGCSALAGLGHTPEHLTELAPRVAALFEALDALRRVDVGGVEMAVAFTATADDPVR